MSGILKTNYNTGKLFIWDNRFVKETYTNGTGSTVTLTKGRVMGRIFSSLKITPQATTATDGSEQPVGVLGDDYTVANGETVTVRMCIGGEVDASLLSFTGSETLDSKVTRTYTDSGTDTVQIPQASIRDLLIRNSHITLLPSEDLTGFDNQ